MNFMYWKLPRITNCATLVAGFMHCKTGKGAARAKLCAARLTYRHRFLLASRTQGELHVVNCRAAAAARAITTREMANTFA